MLLERWDTTSQNLREELIVHMIKEYFKEEKERCCIGGHYNVIMLRNLKIMGIYGYSKMVSSSTINPEDTLVYIDADDGVFFTIFYYPFILPGYILSAYLSKLGFWGQFEITGIDLVVPATGLKYIALANLNPTKENIREYKYLAIELVDLDTVVKNTNLNNIVNMVLENKLRNGEKKLKYEEFEKIFNIYSSQRLFAGHSFDEAWKILHEYYDGYSSKKEVDRITEDYKKIFQPYRVCYYIENWKKIDCMSIKF